MAVNTAESKGDSDFGPNTQTMIDDGCSLVIGVGFMLAPAIMKAAGENPDLHFGLIDSAFTDKDGKPVELKNGRALLFNTQEAAFLAGYVAAGATKSGTVATFGGLQIPSVTIFMDGFVDGVKAYNEARVRTSRFSVGTRKHRTAPSPTPSTISPSVSPRLSSSLSRVRTSSCQLQAQSASVRQQLQRKLAMSS